MKGEYFLTTRATGYRDAELFPPVARHVRPIFLGPA